MVAPYVPVVEVYKDTGKRWRWRCKHPNGKFTAASGESFASRGNALRAAGAFLRSMRRARIVSK